MEYVHYSIGNSHAMHAHHIMASARHNHAHLLVAADTHDVKLQVHTLGLTTQDMVVSTTTQIMLCALIHMTKIVT